MSLPRFPADRISEITDDATVASISAQCSIELRDPRLIGDTAITIVYEVHPTHWLVFSRYEGFAQAEDNGLLLRAFPKALATLVDVKTWLRQHHIALGPETGMAPYRELE